eukprot:symbB.v1.2.021797.t1/scaffold1905.1/size96453/1
MGNCSCRPLACMGMDKKGNTPDPICKHAACSYGEVIDSLSVVVPAPHKLLPENEEVTAMPLEDLEGGWFRKMDGKPVGELHEGQLIWNRRWGLDDASSDVFEISPGVLELEVRGNKYYGSVSREAQASITWDDGDAKLEGTTPCTRIHEELVAILPEEPVAPPAPRASRRRAKARGKKSHRKSLTIASRKNLMTALQRMLDRKDVLLRMSMHLGWYAWSDSGTPGISFRHFPGYRG